MLALDPLKPKPKAGTLVWGRGVPPEPFALDTAPEEAGSGPRTVL